MANDSAVATPESPASRTFTIPVDQPASTHKHGQREFKIPVEGKNFQIPVEAPETPAAPPPPGPIVSNAPHGATLERPEAVEQHFPELPSSMVNILPIANKVKNVVSKWFSDGIGRNLGFGESYAHERARILGNMSVEQYHEYKQQQAQEDKKWYNSFENIPLLNIISSRNDILDVAARAPSINLAAGMSSQQRKKHPIVTHALQSISEFTSPESAKTQLEFTVGGTLLEPFVGAALGWTGTQAAKVGLTKTGQFLASPKALAWAMHGTNLGPVIKDLAVNSYHALALTDQGKTEDAEGAWGDILGNMITLAAMHYGIKGLEAGSEMENTKRLNDSASKLYDKKFTALDPQEKAAVLYDAVGSADPHFNDRVNHEVEKLKRQRGRGLAQSSDVAQKLLEKRQRTEASKTVLNQIITRELQQSAYRQEMARRESEARRAQMEKEDAEKRSADLRQEQEARQAEAHPEPVEKRGARQIVQRGSVYTTEREEGRYEPEPTPAPIQITDRRAAASVIPRTPQVVAAESRVQELSEQRMGVSFSSLPIARQMVAARWMERFHPEAWRDFQGTPAYQTFQGHVERQGQIDAVYKHYLERHPHGEDHVLAPNADVHAGLAQLILNRTDVNTSLAADPKTHRELNESTEASMGKSWDSLEPADRGAALAEFLREDPEHLRAFLTPDITARIRSGQHIDLANMEAELVDRQQVHILMGERDRIQRDMDRSVADQFVTEQRQRHQNEITDTMYQALTGRDPSLEAVHEAGRNITALASDLGLGTISDFGDVFRIEKAVRETPDGLRTPKMREFLTRMAQIRAAAEDHIVRSISEATADSFRTMAPEDAREKAARSMMEYASDAADLQQAADRQRQEGNTAQADATAETAAELRKKADAVQAGAESAQNPAPEKPTVPRPDILLGRETKIVTPSNPQGYQAHYAAVAVDATRSSHLPISYQPREGYNQNGQPRDYSINREAQGNIESKAGQIDADQLLSDSVQALDGPSIVEPERMDIISGNGRDLIEETARIRHRKEYARYMEEKFKRAAKFGLDPEQIRAKFGDRFKIVRVLDKPVVDEHEWARLGIEFNRDPMQGLSQAESGVALSRLLTPGFVGRLTVIIDTLPSVGKDGRPLTIREAMRARSSDLAQLLVDAGVISPNKMAEFVVDGELNENSKSLFENMLGALTVTDPATMEQASASTKDKLARAGLFFVKMRDAGENWDLASMNTDAVRLLTRAQDAAARLSTLIPRKGAEEIAGKSLVDRYLHPENYTDTKGFGPAGTFEFDGQPLHPPVHAGVESLAKAIEESPRDYALMMARYADASNGVQGSMFGAEHPADVFTREIASKYGMKVVPEEWGMVTGLSPVEKAAIEDSRGPLPVEPEEHHSTVTADVTPDSTAVQDAVPEGPRNVRDLRKALETHPGLTNEQADALGTIFEEVIPNAVGEDANTILGNRRLTLALGGTEKTPEGKEARGYHQILEDGRAIIRLCDSADTSTFLHEMAHYIRRYLSPGDQAIANGFVEAKPGEEWTDAQEEKFAQAFERYHYDGGIRRGKLEKVFSTLNRAMQSIYNAVTMRGYAKGTPELNAMFDRWYDWSRAERKPITKRLDVDALVSAANGTVVIPDDAKIIRSSGRKPSENATNKVFLSEEQATEFIKNKKNGVRAWEMYKRKGDDNVYVRADAKKGKKLFQGPNADVFTLAKRARDLEAELKRTTDPREQARLRGVLNGIEDKLRTSSLIVGAAPVTRDTSVIQLVHGVSEMPTALEPTTVAGAEKTQGIFGDPTAIETGRGRGPERAATAGKPGNEPGKAGEVAQPAGAADREHAKREAAPIAKPERDPLAGVRAAKLKAPDVPRGTPVVDPDRWRQHVEDLGLPKGTPPPTIRLEPDIRNMLIFPGQPEAVENVLSALQQYDGTVLASGAGTGKTHMLSAIAQHLLGEGGDKVGLLVTKSQNLIHEADGFVDTARKYGVDVNPLPSDINEVQTGMYAATYSGIRGDKSVLSIPWDFVLFDESGEARNWTESEQGKAVALLGHAANKVVYSSATPYHTVMEMGYMHKLGLWPHGGFFEWAQQFGLREVGPNSYSGGASARRLEKLRQQLIERGQWQQLYKDLSGTEAHVVLVPNSAEVKTGIRNIRAAFAMAKAAFIKEGMSKYITPTAGHESIYLKRYIAGARLNEAIGLAKRAIDAGWRPVMFTEYRSPAETGMDFFHNLPGNLGTKINAMLPPLPDVVAAMRDAFGDKVGIFAGAATELRADQLEGFQSGEKHALYMTYGAGGVGANAQDKFGDQPRLGIYIDMPWGGPMLEQGTNRTYRYGSQSGAANIFLTSDALPEMKLLATKVLPRMRSLKAAVFGEKIESSLSRNLREAAGIPEELLQYEHGEEVTPEAAEFEKTGEGAKYTHLDDFEIPDADKFKHKPMKYKGEGKKLYQGPKEPFEDEADAAWNEMLGRLSKLPAKPAQAIASKEPIIKQHAAEAGRRSMGTGEPVASAVERATRDVENDALIWYDDLKQHTRDAAQFLKSMDWMFGTSGDRAVWKILRDQGLNDTGLELKRRMIDYDLRSGNYRGEFGGMIEKIIRGNKLSAPDLEMVSKVVEGQAQSEDPRILKAVGEFRNFTATVRKRLADAGMAVVFYDEKGKRAEYPYSKIADDPNYWPRIYDWNKKFVLDDGKGGKMVTSLSEIMNMPTSSERREQTIEKFAKARGISKIKAQLFFDKNARGIRLAGNIERAREYELPLYGRDRRALDRYVNEVAEKLAAAEIHGQFREKTDHLIDQIDDRKMRNLVNQIITTDLNPSRLHDADRIALRWANRWLVMSKMSLSALKLPFHLAKTSMATNTRSVVLSMLKGVTSPQELRNNAADCGAMTDYIRQAWMREYGLNTRGWDQTMLDFNGFTFLMKASRVVAAGAGRLFFEKYAYPELRRNPDNPVLRRKLKDLYGMSDEQLTEIAKNGYGPADVRRMELGAANWTTGSGRPSELPVAWRGVGASEDWLAQRFVTIIRIMQSLHGFMFKTANLVNRSVFDELKQGDYKTGGPYHLIGRFAVNFGLAGAFLGGILHIRHQLSGSPEKEIEDRRMAYIASHPASKEAFFWAMSDLSMGMGIDALTQLFDQIATHNPKDREKIVSQGRPMSAMKDLLLGVAAQDAWEAATGFYNYASTFQDTGHHRQSPEERRRNIEVRLANEEIPITRQVMKPQTVKPKGWPRRRRTASALR